VHGDAEGAGLEGAGAEALVGIAAGEVDAGFQRAEPLLKGEGFAGVDQAVEGFGGEWAGA